MLFRAVDDTECEIGDRNTGAEEPDQSNLTIEISYTIVIGSRF